MIDYNPFGSIEQFNPYPILRRLRDEAPVYHNEEFGFYALSRYDDVQAAFLDPETFISGQGVTIGPPEKSNGRLIASDPPEHTQNRKLLARVFSPKRVADLEPFIRRVAASYLDIAAETGRFDLVQDFSLRLPLDVISELLGIPAEHRERIHALANRAVMRDPDPAVGLEDARAAMGQLSQLFLHLVLDRRKSPSDDVISMLIGAEVTDDDGTLHRLTDELIAAQFLLLAAAGHETVMKLIGNGAVALWWYQEQRAELVANPSLIPNAVEEMLRWDNPAPIEGRWSTRETEFHGTVIPANRRVILLMGSANHDERRYVEPELFDIHRKIERPVTFGFGIHLCIGAALARLETRIAFEELLRRFPNYEIDESQVNRGPVTFFRGLMNLPVVV